MISTTTEENVNPTEEPSASEIRAYVPSSDRRLVLAAIDNQLTAAKSAWKEKNADQNNPAKEEFFMKCLDQTAASLKQQLEATTIPADEEEVEQTLDSFQMRLLSTRPEDDDDDECDGESISSDEEDEKDISFDDDDIVNEEVLERVQKCRSDVREVAARVISTREEACKKALSFAERDIEHVLEVHGFNSSNRDEEATDEGQIGDANERDVMNPMHVALQTLTSSLQDVDSGLADKINDLKNTIGVVDRYIEKNERMSQGDDNVLSQTEKALFTSECDTGENVEFMVEEDNDAQMNPDKKLARLLAGVL